MLCALVDFLCACVIFIALGAALTAVIAGLNALAGAPIVDISATFDAIATAPLDHLWVFAMLFSTLLPTTIHFALSLFGAQVFAPALLRRFVAGHLRNAENGETAAIFAPMAAALIGTLPFVIMTALGWLLWHFGQETALCLISIYGDVLLWIANNITGL